MAHDMGKTFKILTNEELDVLIADQERKICAGHTIIDEARFWEMLEVLPPCRWGTVGGYEVFHVSERLSGNLVSWFAHRGDNYYEFTEQAHINTKALTQKLKNITDYYIQD